MITLTDADRALCAEDYRRAAQDAARRGNFDAAVSYLKWHDFVSPVRDEVEIEVDVMFEDAPSTQRSAR